MGDYGLKSWSSTWQMLNGEGLWASLSLYQSIELYEGAFGSDLPTRLMDIMV
jgi:hypothetical protein